ncbi:MAG: AzlD domain-containing protein [Faecalibacterium sp.]|nr:AzlD domain-containing protein [Faecalibacterium sp.]
MNQTVYAAALVGVAALCTLLTRALPFVLLGGKKELSPRMQAVSRTLPAAVMALLVIYCLRGTGFAAPAQWLPAFAGVAATAALHVWKRSELLSIGGGTLCYMLLLRLL